MQPFHLSPFTSVLRSPFPAYNIRLIPNANAPTIAPSR
jgi:hypothetical protein